MSQQRSVQFSQEPVQAKTPPPKTPKAAGPASASIIESTPSRPSTFSTTANIPNTSMAKEYLFEELKNFFEPFNALYFEKLLKEASSDSQCTQFLHATPVYDNRDGIWKDLPQAPNHEKQLYEPLVAITNAILSHFGLQTSRKALDRHNVNMKTQKTEGLKSRPDIAITASGPHFQGKIVGTQKKKRKEEKEETSWHECLSVIEVKKDKLKSTGDEEGEDESESENGNGNGDGDEDGDEEEEELVDEGQQKQGNRPGQCSTATLKQLVFYAQQIFSHQPTRMFVYTILMTQCHVRLFRFDRVGVQFSERINYQDEPIKLVQIIKLVAGADVEKVGLDRTVTFENGKMQFILQKDNKPFIVIADPNPRFGTRSFRGRSTFCWTVYDEDGKRHILKQQFVATGRRKEHELLEEVSKQAGPDVDLTTIGQCILAQCFGKVSESRGLTQDAVERTKFHDRELYRVLLVEHGDRIGNLNGKTILDFLVAFRDAISGHQTLWNAGVIHRDISTNNILYRSKERTDATHRGVLIDLDLAVDLIRNTSNAKVDFRTGTKAFQSISVLRGHHMLHDHLDDLQSFFWVLLWITRKNVGPGANYDRDYDKDLSANTNFDSIEDGICAYAKEGILGAPGRLCIQPGWGDHILTLARGLAQFFYTHNDTKENNANHKKALTPDELFKAAPAHYRTVLEHFDVVIAAVRQDIEANTTTVTPITSSLLPALDITPPITPSVPSKSSKRSRSSNPANAATEAPASPPPPRAKRPRTSKSAPNLSQLQSQEAGSTSKQSNKGKKKAKADSIARANSQGTPAETSSGRPVRGSHEAPLTASTTRGGSKSNAKVSDAKV